MAENWFLFQTRATFRISPGPGWVWPVSPPSAGPDRPVPGWPTEEYLEMTAALSDALTQGAPTLSYTDPVWGGPVSLVVKNVFTEIPLRVDATGTGMGMGTVGFETACFGPEATSTAGPGARLGEWLSWVDFTYQGGSAGVQLLSLELMSVSQIGTGGSEGGEGGYGMMCEPMLGGPLYVRPGSEGAVG